MNNQQDIASGTEPIEQPHDGNRKVQPMVLRPGSGWKHLKGLVWEHSSGVRIHTAGLIRTNREITHRYWYGCPQMDLLIKINGGNRKRGMMAYAQTMFIPQNNSSATSETQKETTP